MLEMCAHIKKTTTTSGVAANLSQIWSVVHAGTSVTDLPCTRQSKSSKVLIQIRERPLPLPDPNQAIQGRRWRLYRALRLRPETLRSSARGVSLGYSIVLRLIIY